MTNEQLKKYLEENLEIKIRPYSSNDPDDISVDIVVSLLLNGKTISESSLTLPS